MTLADIGRTASPSEPVLRTPMLPAPTPFRAHRRRGLRQIREPAGHQLLQGARRARPSSPRSTTPSAARGVIAMSAGNHAQAVAYHAARLGIPATIVMPVTTPFVKVAATEAHGAEVVLDGETVAEAQARAETMPRERRPDLVHPYDDPHVIAGQGTIALEMLEDGARPRHAGGPDRRRRADLRHGDRGAARMKPEIEIVGVEAALYPSMWNALTRRAAPIGGADAGRRHRGEECRQADAADRAARWCTRSCWSTRRSSSARSTPI